MSKILEILGSLKIKLKFKLKNTMCICNAHDWIYIFNENDRPTKRYCENCRRQEKYSYDSEEYLRIKDISYSEMD